MENLAVILVGTKHPGNLGAVARAMNNMGLRELRLVAPQCSPDDEASRMARTGFHILENARRFRSLRSALRGIHFAVGTTGAAGGYRRQVRSPRDLAPEILDRAAVARVGIIFGPEDTGLVDDDLILCQALSRIPTDPAAMSINLAQAVMILCYELRMTQLERSPRAAPKLASVHQVEAMYAQLERALLEIGFLQEQNARHMMFSLRRLLGRAGLSPADVGILRGIARQLNWYAGSRTNKSS